MGLSSLYRVVWTVYTLWILTPCQSQHLQTVFPIHRLSFHFVDGFLCCAKALIIVFISFALGDWSKKILLWLISKSILPLFSSWSLTWGNVQISLFYMWLSSFPSATCWRVCLLSIVYSSLLCHRLINYSYVYLFLDPLFCSIIYVSVLMPVLCCFDYCSFVLLSKIWKGYTSSFVLFLSIALAI